MGDTQGVRLPYFHRIQSQEDKDLIGDITPKIIKNEIKSCGNRGALPSASWNAAETWEERDCSHWSSQKIAELFDTDFEITCDGCVTKIGSLGKYLHRSHLCTDLSHHRDYHPFSYILNICGNM